MAKKTQVVINDEVKEKACNAIDDVSESIKKASRAIFDVIVENTAVAFSDIFECAKTKIKEKISERGKDDGKNKDLSNRD